MLVRSNVLRTPGRVGGRLWQGIRMVCTSLRPARVAVVGAGPAGFYTAIDLVKEAKIAENLRIHIDILDRLPVPGGLVRSGVAPDHPEVKLVQNRFRQFLIDQEHDIDRVRFFGNVSVGQIATQTKPITRYNDTLHVSLPALQSCYDAIVLCCGSERDRRLNIPGKDLNGVFSAGEFVRHYNAGFPPDYDGDDSQLVFDFAATHKVGIIGHGNVGLDIARVILKGSGNLESTDITDRALNTLSTSAVSEVHLFGRRGPAQMAFSNKELREMFDDIENPSVYVRKDHVLQMNDASNEEIESSRPRKRMLQLITKRAKLLSAEEMKERLLSTVGETHNGRATYIHFFSSPFAYIGENGRLAGAEFEWTTLSGGAGSQSARGTGERFQINGLGAVFESIGYEAMPVVGVPMHKGKALHCGEGRVINSTTNTPMQGLYVSGWFKRGPGGIIGTNIWDAKETSRALLEDLKQGRLPLDNRQPMYAGLDDLCQEEGMTDGLVTLKDALTIERNEEAKGSLVRKPRVKGVTVQEMLSLARDTQ